MNKNPIICAVDTPDVAKAAALASELKGSVGAIKLGLEFFTANGAVGVAKVAKAPVFLDLKFHDIPNTVSKAIAATKDINAFMITVHTAGGRAMMEAAAKAAKELPHKPLVVGVTVLTSLDQNDLRATGVNDVVSDQVKRLAALAQESGLDGVVCSPHEIAVLREQCGKDFTLVVPGIRPTNYLAHALREGAGVEKHAALVRNDDQKRIMTPKQAMEQGANYLVIGRPITGAENPQKAAEEIFSSLRGA